MKTAYKDNTVSFQNGKQLNFEYNILELIEFQKFIFILLDIPIKSEENYNDHHNVYGLSKEGNLFWQIGLRPKGDISVYTMIRIVDNKLYANDFMGRRYNINERNGFVIGDGKLVK